MAFGYEVRQPAQEHSYVPDMWRRLSRPDILIYLDIDNLHLTKRRPLPQMGGGPGYLAEQHRRLAHARHHCDFYIDTSGLTPDQVQVQVLSFLKREIAQ